MIGTCKNVLNTFNRANRCCHYRKIAYDLTQLVPKKWLTKSCNLCWKGIGRTPTIGVILKINEKFIKNSNKLLLVGFLEKSELDQKQFG